MDASQSLDHYTNRRDLLRAFLSEYELLADEAPEVVEHLSFDGYVHFSFAYYRITEQTDGVERMASLVKKMRNQLLS